MSVRLAKWTKNLKTGHRDIDEQHQNLFQRFDGFIETTLRNEGEEKIKDLISFLIEYTDEHFSYEEGYYSSKHYPEISAHRKAHEKFTENLRIIKRTYHNEKGKIDAQKLNGMLGEWFRGHIQQSDMDAIRWIEKNPIKI
jgi:hemerythrin